MSFFIDWDRAKSARRDLVEAFLESAWPPCRLLAAASKAGVEYEVLNRLKGKHRGLEYLKKLTAAVEQLPLPEREKFEDVLAAWYRNQA